MSGTMAGAGPHRANGPDIRTGMSSEAPFGSSFPRLLGGGTSCLARGVSSRVVCSCSWLSSAFVPKPSRHG